MIINEPRKVEKHLQCKLHALVDDVKLSDCTQK